ncbi:hypothetical protein OAY23_02035, partial [bacterium]|nr:hypothetical protein [bacterium]
HGGVSAIIALIMNTYWGASMQITRVFTGDDGESHFEELHLELIDQGAVGAISEMWPTKGVMFRRVDGDYDLGFSQCTPTSVCG